MNDDNDKHEESTIELPETELPTQESATDTSNWDNKVSTDPSGEKYIRTED